MRAFAWGGALLFVGALAWFGYQFAVTFAEVIPGSPDVQAVAIDVALFSAFALHHSVFARTPMRQWLTRVAGSNERSIYVWVASLLFIAVCTAWQPVAGVAWSARAAARWTLWSLQALGVLLTLRAAAVLDFRELAGLTAPRVADGGLSPAGSGPEFKTTGPYGWVRHPIYAAWFLMVLPATPMTMTRLVFAVASCVYLLVAIPFEEATLRATSGAAYDAYRRQVKWRLVPGIF